MIKVEIIADSVNPVGIRLTTAIWTYPRFIHSEVMTHRALSKNASSSRAIPVEKMIQSIIDDPALPIHWGKNQKGMQANEEVEHPENCKKIWLDQRYMAIDAVEYLGKQGLHKQVANRLLEPWAHMNTLVSGTDWDNFFALRVHPDAQPEFQALAVMMLEAMIAATPKRVEKGGWHLPFADKYLEENCNDLERLRQACIGRCARVSYKTQNNEYSIKDDLNLFERLAKHVPLHSTPMEHIAEAREDGVNWNPQIVNEGDSNFRGWTQYRKLIKGENVKGLDWKEHLKWYYDQKSKRLRS